MAVEGKIVARKSDLPGVVGLSYSTVARLERRGEFPKRRKLADGSVGWLASELEEWARSLPIAQLGLRGEATRLRREAAA